MYAGEDPVASSAALDELDREAGLLDLPVERPLAARCRGCATSCCVIVEPPWTTWPALDVLHGRARRCPRSRRRRARRSGGPRSRRSPSRIHGLTLSERDRLAVPLGRDRTEQRAVGRVDERVLADLDRPAGRSRLQLERNLATAPTLDGDHGQDDHEQRRRRSACVAALALAPGARAGASLRRTTCSSSSSPPAAAAAGGRRRRRHANTGLAQALVRRAGGARARAARRSARQAPRR